MKYYFAAANEFARIYRAENNLVEYWSCLDNEWVKSSFYNQKEAALRMKEISKEEAQQHIEYQSK